MFEVKVEHNSNQLLAPQPSIHDFIVLQILPKVDCTLKGETDFMLNQSQQLPGNRKQMAYKFPDKSEAIC